MLLVTTAIEKTWGKNEKILFMGEWCKLYKQRHIWNQRVSKTLPDPWSNRKKRFDANQYVENLYQETMISLGNILNNFHNVNYSVRYWKILCGPWVRLFINIIYHKWECVEEVIKSSNKINTYGLNIDHKNMVPGNIVEFYKLLVSDQWNHYICMQVIKEKKIPYKILDFDNSEHTEFELNSFDPPSKSQNLLNKMFQIAMRLLNRPTSVFLSRPYLSKLGTILLSARLRTIPRIGSSSNMSRGKTYFKDLDRHQTIGQIKQSSDFQSFLNKIILSHIPYNYFEGFNSLLQDVAKLGWQEFPTTILTANDHFVDDIFKCYAANKTAIGAKLKIICHGGGGKMKYHDYLTHEMDICDQYFTWGWSEYLHNKCTKGFIVKKTLRKRSKNTNQTTLLHIMLSEVRYQHFISAEPSYEQFINQYVDDQTLFLKNLSNKIRCKTIIKLHYDFQNSIEDRINEKCYSVQYAKMDENYLKLLKNCKLAISTYNCTTPVETIAMNIPTIIFWNPKHWELSSSALNVFNKLRECGIFHETPESAASMVSKIWNNVDDWWQSRDVILACKEFKMSFCRETNSPTKDLFDFINHIES